MVTARQGRSGRPAVRASSSSQDCSRCRGRRAAEKLDPDEVVAEDPGARLPVSRLVEPSVGQHLVVVPGRRPGTGLASPAELGDPAGEVWSSGLLAERPRGGSEPRRHSAAGQPSRSAPARCCLEQPVADRPALAARPARPGSARRRSVVLVASRRQIRRASRSRARDGMGEEPEQVGRGSDPGRHRSGGSSGPRPGRAAAVVRRAPAAGAAARTPRSAARSKLNGCAGRRTSARSGSKLRRIEGLQRMPHGQVLTDRPPVRCRAVRSRASSSSPIGTAGGRPAPVRGSAPA